MNAPFLSGLLAAWTAAQIAIGIFFLMAYSARRNEREYLIFGLVCFAVASIDAGLTFAYGAPQVEGWLVAARVANAAAAIGTALNAHFILAYTGYWLTRARVVALYVLGVAGAALSIGNRVFDLSSIRIQHVSSLGFHVDQVSAAPTFAGSLFFTTIICIQVALVPLMFKAYRSGKSEALSTLVGLVFGVLLVVHDVLVAAGKINMAYLHPYGFLTYGFGVANTLLVRYRRAAAELEAKSEELRQATDELTSSYLELGDVQEELFRRRQLASVGELAASIAHEVRNPLAIIRNAAANLRRPRLAAEDRGQLFEIIEEEIKRLNGLVTELLRFARPVNVERSDVALAELFKSFASALAERWSLQVNIPEDVDVSTVYADPALLRLAVDNLVENCRQAMPEGGTITVNVSPDSIGAAQTIRIEIHDTGQGMDEKTLERAADPFFTTRPEGTGLGLPIVQRIVEAHNGRLEISSTMGKGTTVGIILPAKRRDSLMQMDMRRDSFAASEARRQAE